MVVSTSNTHNTHERAKKSTTAALCSPGLACLDVEPGVSEIELQGGPSLSSFIGTSSIRQPLWLHKRFMRLRRWDRAQDPRRAHFLGIGIARYWSGGDGAW